jgi:enterochelin esterase-like enzyme
MNIESPGTEQIDEVMVETIELQSELLKRTVKIDFYQIGLGNSAEEVRLLLMNDGQDLVTMDFENMTRSLTENNVFKPLLIAAIHCGTDRKNEYGMSVGPDYKGWGTRAGAYDRFIVEELLPFIHSRFHNISFNETGFAGFSLGALSALDIAWNHPHIFSRVGVFSGSLWWRSIDKSEKGYDPWIHRMMHRQILITEQRPEMKFFFECGELDEWEDRNRNGVIDSIDDTIDLMRILINKGYREGKDIQYLQLPEGKHDVPSWAKALPRFLKWGYGEKGNRES